MLNLSVGDTAWIKNMKNIGLASHQKDKSGVIPGEWSLTTREEQSQLSNNKNCLFINQNHNHHRSTKKKKTLK